MSAAAQGGLPGQPESLELGEILVRETRLTPEQLERARLRQLESHERLADVLVEEGLPQRGRGPARARPPAGARRRRGDRPRRDRRRAAPAGADHLREAASRPAPHLGGPRRPARGGRRSARGLAPRRPAPALRRGRDRGRAGARAGDPERDQRRLRPRRRLDRPARRGGRGRPRCPRDGARRRAQGPARVDGRCADHPAGELDAPARREGARERHPHRALRARDPRALPDRRRALRAHEAAAAGAAAGDRLAHQDHGQARHRREAPAPGRPHPPQDRGPRLRRASLDGPRRPRRAPRPASPARHAGAARPLEDRLQRDPAPGARSHHPPPERHLPGHRAHRLGQDGRPSTPLSTRSTGPRRTSSRSRTRSRSRRRAWARSRSTPRST